MHTSPGTRQELQHSLLMVWFNLVLEHALGAVSLHCIRYDHVCSEMNLVHLGFACVKFSLGEGVATKNHMYMYV